MNANPASAGGGERPVPGTPRLGGFLIFGNNVETIERSLRSLLEVCDEVVAIDSHSSDGSADIVERLGGRRILHPWRGFGAARRRAAEALGECDYLVFLDADEAFSAGAAEAFAAWRASRPEAPAYSLLRRDWVWEDETRYVFRAEKRKRVLRRDIARWEDSMIVHEAISGAAEPMALSIDHYFTLHRENRLQRNELYALLWALMSFDAGKRLKSPPAQRWAHFLRNLILKGSLFRGGLHALKLSWQVADYHALKYAFLRELSEGRHPELLELFRSGEYGALFTESRRLLSPKERAPRLEVAGG